MEWLGLVSAIGALVLGAPVIQGLKRIEARQTIYPYAPEIHRAKEGTPTMGGLILLLATAIAGIGHLLLSEKPQRAVLSWLIWGWALIFAGLGFLDDWLLQRLSGRRGLGWRAKLGLQLLAAFGACWMLCPNPLLPPPGVSWPLPVALFGTLWVTAWVNAFNLTDGLDGLAAGLSVIAFACLGVWAQEAAIRLTAFVWAGACLGYLWWNAYPAQVFMGDTGSMALGATFGLSTLQEGLYRRDVLEGFGAPLLMGLVFAVEVGTVIVQLSWVKLFKKRLFRATPIHHHFEYLNWAEPKIVQRFWIIGLLSALLALGLTSASRP